MKQPAPPMPPVLAPSEGPSADKPPPVPSEVEALCKRINARIDETGDPALETLSSNELLSLLPWTEEVGVSWYEKGWHCLSEQDCCSTLARRGGEGWTLLGTLRRSPNPRVRLAALCEFCSVGDASAIKECVDTLDSSQDPRLQISAECWLRECHQPSLGIAVEKVFGHVSDERRKSNLLYLVASNAGEAALPWMIDLTRNSPVPKLRQQALCGVASVNSPSADAFLLEQVESDNREYRSIALRGLLEHSHPVAPQLLVREFQRNEVETWRMCGEWSLCPGLLDSDVVREYLTRVAEEPANPNAQTARYWLDLAAEHRRESTGGK